MKEKRKPRIPLLVRVVILPVILLIVLYLSTFIFICIRENNVLSEVPQTENYEAIIVLGAQVYPDGTLSVQLTWRMDAALKAYQQKAVPVVVCGAQGQDEPTTEADAMKQYLMQNGIPEKDILTDPASFNTKQSLKNAAVLLENIYGIKKVLIVTSDYHVMRSLALAQDLGFEACGMGSPCKPEYWLKNHARETLAWCNYWAVKYMHLPLE